MRAVNLLPEKHRPRTPTGGAGNSSYILLGVLGAIVVAVLVYVMTANSINSAKTDIAQANAETARANAQAQALGAYGDFAKVKQQRVQAVKQLAEGRVDWERLVREFAHVLPDGVWVSKVDAADSPANLSTGGATGAPADPTTSGSGPAVQVQGCAPSQAAVAETLVRFRELQGAEDVKLVESTQPDTSGGSTGTGAGAASTGSGDCGTSHGHTNWEFQAAVSFEAPAGTPYKPGAVPARLGGGQ